MGSHQKVSDRSNAQYESFRYLLKPAGMSIRVGGGPTLWPEDTIGGPVLTVRPQGGPEKGR